MNILIIEDDSDDAKHVLRGLKRVGFTGKAVVKRDGADAAEYLDKTKLPPDLILLDLTLPIMSGLEILRWLKQHKELSGIPVFVLSGSPYEQSIREAYALGAKTFFVKPLDMSQISAIAGAAVE